MLEDIATLTGGSVISEEIGRKLDSTTFRIWVVRAGRVQQGREDGCRGPWPENAIKSRIQQIRTQITETTSDFDKEKLQDGWPSLLARSRHQRSALRLKLSSREEAPRRGRALATRGGG